MKEKPMTLTLSHQVRIATLAAIAALSSSCKEAPAPKESEAPPPADVTDKTKPTTKAFGAPLTPGPKVALASLISKPDSYLDQTIITEGQVARACSRKGCWMELTDGESKCRVTFKDYGFFVPTDSQGANARLQGKITTRTLSAGRVKHLEEEGASFANKQADGTAQEVRLIATAVQLTR